MNTFQTRSSAKRSVITVILTFIPMFALAFLGLKIAVTTWLFFEGMLLLTFGFCLFLVSRTHWEIEFRGSTLLLYNTGNRQSYCIENLSRSDLTVRQSTSQKQKNCCDLKIHNTSIALYDVMYCDGLQAYINAHLPE